MQSVPQFNLSVVDRAVGQTLSDRIPAEVGKYSRVAVLYQPSFPCMESMATSVILSKGQVQIYFVWNEALRRNNFLAGKVYSSWGVRGRVVSGPVNCTPSGYSLLDVLYTVRTCCRGAFVCSNLEFALIFIHKRSICKKV